VGTAWTDLDAALRNDAPSFGFDVAKWEKVRAAHAGHQLGLEILGVLPLIAAKVGFFDLELGADLEVRIPAPLLDPAEQDAMRRVLAPPPVQKSDEIVAAMGGTYWSREAPGLPAFVERGTHFDKGQPLYIIEVMKMFNKVYAPFAGHVTQVLIADEGVVVRKGQPLLKVAADEALVVEEPKERARRIRANTDTYLTLLL
jgi:biotin carboxyl carrier protein